MKLVFRGHDDRYAVEQSLLAFFPEERPVYQAPEPGEDDWARVALHQSPVYATAITEITYGGRLGRGMSRALLRGVDDEYERERLRQKAVKLSFFKAAREITGLTPAWGALTGIRPGKLAARLLEEGKTPAQARRILGDTYYVSPSRRGLAVENAQEGLRASPSAPPAAPIAASCPSRWKNPWGWWSRIWMCCAGRSPTPRKWSGRRACASSPSIWAAAPPPPCRPSRWTGC